MHGERGNEAAPPSPLPPELPDLYGRRRELATIQTEIGFLEEEVKSLEGHQPASRACKEVVEFVTYNADPLIPISRGENTRRSRCFWKRLCGLSCFSVCCSSNPEKTRCCEGPSCSWCSSSCWCNCNSKSKCRCMFNTPSCLTCSTNTHRCYPKPKLNMCSCGNKTSCYSCCFCS